MSVTPARRARVLGAGLRHMLSEEPGLSAGQPIGLLPADPWYVDEEQVTLEEKRAAMNLADRESLLQINRDLNFPTPVDWLPAGREYAEDFDGDVDEFIKARQQRNAPINIYASDGSNIAANSTNVTQNQAATQPRRTPSWSLERPDRRKDVVLLTNQRDAGPAYDVDIQPPGTPLFRGETHHERVDPGQKIKLALRFTGQTRFTDRSLALTYREVPEGEKKTWTSSVP